MADDDYEMDVGGYEDEPVEPELDVSNLIPIQFHNKFVKSGWMIVQEGAEEDIDGDNKEEDITDPLLGDNEDNEDQQGVEKPRKTIKYMTKYERARILGTRALQIRYGVFVLFCCSEFEKLNWIDLLFVVCWIVFV